MTRVQSRTSFMDVEWWKSFFEIGGVALLFLTFAFGAGFMWTGKKVNERQAERLRVFDTDLTAAKTEQDKQRERASIADARVAGLEKDADDAKAEMAKQQTRAATAEKSLLELQEKAKYRTVTAHQESLFFKSVGLPVLSRRRGEMIQRGTIAVYTLSSDPESVQYAEQLQKLLYKAGYNSPMLKKTAIVGDNAIGLSLLMSSSALLTPDQFGHIPIGEDSPIKFSEHIAAGFQAAGIPLTRFGVVGVGDKDEVVLMVGHKP